MSELETVFRENKICVLVPTFNNAGTLAQVLKKVSTQTNNVIVVNDGSTDDTLEVLKEFSHLHVVSYRPNKGKGFALRKGFEEALLAGYDHAITIDSDGQHDPADIRKFTDYFQDHRNAIIIGSRNMDQPGIPGKSTFGNKFSNFWFWVETGIRRNDTQSGFRLYPIRALSALAFYTNKFEFEIEVLVRAAWHGIEILEVPVKVFYPPREKRISHFRPVRDFTRISILNTVLVTIALLYIKPRDFIQSFKKKSLRTVLRELLFNADESDTKKAISVGFGIFMGIVPIWGFQLIVAISLAILYKLNKALVVLAANISIPPLIPPILYASHVTGKIWMGDQSHDISFTSGITMNTIEQSFIQYITGAITLATILGVTAGMLTYIALKMMKGKSKVNLR
jgi:glycosyltransferase involved in cell wall biosynthesis